MIEFIKKLYVIMLLVVCGMCAIVPISAVVVTVKDILSGDNLIVNIMLATLSIIIAIMMILITIWFAGELIPTI